MIGREHLAEKCEYKEVALPVPAGQLRNDTDDFTECDSMRYISEELFPATVQPTDLSIGRNTSPMSEPLLPLSRVWVVNVFDQTSPCLYAVLAPRTMFDYSASVSGDSHSVGDLITWLELQL